MANLDADDLKWFDQKFEGIHSKIDSNHEAVTTRITSNEKQLVNLDGRSHENQKDVDELKKDRKKVVWAILAAVGSAVMGAVSFVFKGH